MNAKHDGGQDYSHVCVWVGLCVCVRCPCLCYVVLFTFVSLFQVLDARGTPAFVSVGHSLQARQTTPPSFVLPWRRGCIFPGALFFCVGAAERFCGPERAEQIRGSKQRPLLQVYGQGNSWSETASV